MTKLIETMPSPPYFGEIDAQDASLDVIAALAEPLPQFYRPYAGRLPARAFANRLFSPAFLPVDEGDDGACLWRCLTGSAAPAAAGGGVAASGMIPKSWVGLPRGMAGASHFTTPGSIIAHRYPRLGRFRVPRPLPNRAPVTSMGGVRLVPTSGLLRFIGRWIPGIGWALLDADLVSIDHCVANCAGHRSILRAACEELTPFRPKPAY